MSTSPETDVNGKTAAALDATDRKVLSMIQAGFPLERSPYREIAERVGLTEEQALQRVQTLRKRGLLRRIGGVLNTKKLGLTGTLVALRVPTDRIEEVAAIVNECPNVTHNYLRDYEYNMWFTVTANSREEVTEAVAQIGRSTGIDDLLELPSIKTFKIGVKLNFENT